MHPFGIIFLFGGIEMLDKKYDQNEVEKDRYNYWLNHHYFECGDTSKKPYAIVIPPPNVTGKLHLGHAWDTTLQDIIIRFKRMQGYDCLWLPGTDHAAIATEAKVVARLKEQGINKYALGREKFLEECFKWTDEHKSIIHSQWAKLGLSVDLTKERFTLDEGLSNAVKYVFVDLYNKGLIYRGERIINWDPVAKTSLSNEEVIYKNIEGAFYHLKYYLEDSDEYLDVATTRPETLFGDTAVAVNPKDERYNKLIGKNVILPIVGKKIPIVGDEHADPSFGTGVVKITPAHDPNDFEVGIRHNLERIKVINEDGTMNDKALKYQGMDRFVARDELIKDLKKADLLINIEPMVHSVGHSERTNAIVEPYLSKQWFVKMESLAKKVLENQKNKDTKVNFVPPRFEKIMNNWMSDCHDWCISRQLWWGHRIPAWYKGDEVYVSLNPPEGEGWMQDEDVLDTWFSSALWPFSTMGWPDNLELYNRYFPTDTLVTGYDIIFFWVCRMTFQSLEFTEKRPFKHCVIHGLIRDKQGRKMSKSLGNGVDPMDMIDTYGADALRYYLTTSSAPGMDLRFDEEKLKSTWNFINKLWNASRFTLMNIEDLKDMQLNELNKQDKWILTRLNKTIKDVTKYMEKFEFNNVNSIIYSFIWNDFCDNYIEMAKFSNNSVGTKSTLLYTLSAILKMLHPFMPYVTDAIYNELPIKDSESIMISSYPVVDKKLIFVDAESEVDEIITFIKNYRTVIKENNILNTYEVQINFSEEIIMKMLKLQDHIINKPKNMTKFKVSSKNYEAIIYYEKELTKDDVLQKEKRIEELKASISKREALLNNENFVSKAPKDLVDKEKEKLASEKEELKKITE